MYIKSIFYYNRREKLAAKMRDIRAHVPDALVHNFTFDNMPGIKFA